MSNTLANQRPLASAMPNNFGPFVLIVLGLLLSPAGVGIPLLLFAISRIRSLDGQREFRHWFPWLGQ